MLSWGGENPGCLGCWEGRASSAGHTPFKEGSGSTGPGGFHLAEPRQVDSEERKGGASRSTRAHSVPPRASAQPGAPYWRQSRPAWTLALPRQSLL